jgi:hypothetical protein
VVSAVTVVIVYMLVLSELGGGGHGRVVVMLVLDEVMLTVTVVEGVVVVAESNSPALSLAKLRREVSAVLCARVLRPVLSPGGVVAASCSKPSIVRHSQDLTLTWHSTALVGPATWRMEMQGRI